MVEPLQGFISFDESVPGDHELSNQANCFGLWTCLQAATVSTLAVAIYYYFPAHEGWKAEST